MALALLSVNICQFSGCGLNFGNLHDLLQHIEETHIRNLFYQFLLFFGTMPIFHFQKFSLSYQISFPSYCNERYW